MKRCLALALALLLAHATAAWPCGGSSYFAPALHPAAKDLATDEYDGTDVEPFRFLDPFRLARLHQGERLAQIAYAMDEPSGEDPAVLAGLDALTQAIAQGDRGAARTAAALVVDTLLSLPAPLATPSAAGLKRAVEFLEVEPMLAEGDAPQVPAVFAGSAAGGGPPLLDQVLAIRAAPFAEAATTLARFPDSPRRPSLELAVLRNRMTTEIGNGWPGQIQGTAPETWAALLAAHNDWLTRYPDHPLADLARLQQVRILYLNGDADAAWGLLFDLYEWRPARALWEMRHLVRNGMVPQNLSIAGLPDPVLAAALLGFTAPLSPADWDRLWQRAEATAGAPWAVNLQERLLLALAAEDDGELSLPGAFPVQPARPSELWAQLRTLVLKRAGRLPEALHQAELLDAQQDPRSAAILAGVLAEAGQATQAAALGALDEDTAVYLLHVVANDAPLAAMARGAGPRAALAAEALACRRLGSGDWVAGARALDAAIPERAALWREAAKRASDSSAAGRLALARWLLDARGALFRANDPGMSRGLKGLLDSDLTEDQRARLVAWLLRCGEEQQALNAYGAALERLNPRGREAAEALREADRLYNRLINWDVSQSDAYAGLLAATPAATQIRTAGKAIRGAPAGR
jgi:hypothetical protein